VGFVQREIDRLRATMLAGAENRDELYAAQQALEWVLEPSGVKSPYLMLTGSQEDSANYQSACNPASSEYRRADQLA
jgi:hypothetical protein